MGGGRDREGEEGWLGELRARDKVGGDIQDGVVVDGAPRAFTGFLRRCEGGVRGRLHGRSPNDRRQA